MLGISEDGSYVYFSAAGQLVAGKGRTQAENITKGEAAVYGYHAGTLFYATTIGAIEAGDAPAPFTNSSNEVDTLSGGEINGGSNSGHGIRYLQSRVSPSGNYLLLATRVPQQEYRGAVLGETFNNEDNSVAGQRDWEQYEYSAAASSLTCVSCGSNRAQRPLEGNEGNFGPLGPFEEVRDGSIHRNLLNDGRVFINSITPLVAQAKTATLHAYEWAPEGVGSCAAGSTTGCVSLLDSGADTFPTYVEGASADGENVYVTSHAQLASQDEDGLRDIYDVRVGGGIERSIISIGCETQECPGPLPPGFVPPPHASESAVGGQVSTITRVTDGGVLGSTMGKLKVIRHSTKGSTLTLVVFAPGAGRLVVAGRGLNGLRHATSRSGTYIIRVSLAARGRAAVRHGRRVRVSVHVSFAPTHGASSAGTFTAAFR